MKSLTTVVWSRRVQKKLERVPTHIVRKFYAWVVDVEFSGIRVVRCVPGYHDEPLSGKRRHERSVRLNIAWRAIYMERSHEKIEVLEVTHHDY